MITTTPARSRGRPRKANPLTPAERSQRHRDKKRIELHRAVEAILALLAIQASKPYDQDEEDLWQKSVADQSSRIENEFQESMRWFDNLQLPH